MQILTLSHYLRSQTQPLCPNTRNWSLAWCCKESKSIFKENDIFISAEGFILMVQESEENSKHCLQQQTSSTFQSWSNGNEKVKRWNLCFICKGLWYKLLSQVFFVCGSIRRSGPPGKRGALLSWQVARFKLQTNILVIFLLSSRSACVQVVMSIHSVDGGDLSFWHVVGTLPAEVIVLSQHDHYFVETIPGTMLLIENTIHRWWLWHLLHTLSSTVTRRPPSFPHPQFATLTALENSCAKTTGSGRDAEPDAPWPPPSGMKSSLMKSLKITSSSPRVESKHSFCLCGPGRSGYTCTAPGSWRYPLLLILPLIDRFQN